ncbi:MAG TPA: hypothetical protein VKB21_06660 [Candidatus Acidoferrum sp.]|nr:hypothetical protein [Candidatus Acidoferrum sp.]
MKTFKSTAPLAALVALFFAVSLGVPYASAHAAAISPATTTVQQAQQQPQQPAQPQDFTGKIMQLKNGQLALVTGKTDKGYSGHFLDDQDSAKKFVNKDVKVTGTLDAATNTIHVTNIKGS